MKTISIPVKCQMIIDEHRFIGEDPVGHACWKNAHAPSLFKGKWYMMCADCIHTNESRLSTYAKGGLDAEDALRLGVMEFGRK